MTLPNPNHLPEPPSDAQAGTQSFDEPTPNQQQSAGNIGVSGQNNALSLVNAAGNVETDQSHRDISVGGNLKRSAVVSGDRNIITYTTNVFGSFDTESFDVRPSQQLSQQEYRWRQVLVKNVQHYWIEGVLERSLHNQALIELGLEERSQAVASPISSAEEFARNTQRPFSKGTQATVIFDNLGAGRTLLILGEPGAGKTTTLLKLAKTLLNRIDDDFSQPIPVILNLSSWAKRRQPIAEWLVQDLYETFQVSRALGTTWIEKEQLTLCLDGLDEVASQHRDACVRALNQFLQAHGRTEIVVCSRVHDYEALSERLKVKCAIYVQPLSDQQIDQYFAKAGEQLSALSTVLNRSPEIKSFADSPLILSVMSLAYQGCSLEEFPSLGSVQAFRQRLFDTYIERMLLRRGKARYYTEQQTKRWLVWIAQQMVQSSQTVFFIENIQPIWLHERQRLEYRLGSSLIFGLTFGLIFGCAIRIPAGLFMGSSVALVALTLGEITPVETLRWSWKAAKETFRSGSIFGLFAGLVGGLAILVTVGVENPLSGLRGVVMLWLLGGLLGGLVGGLLGSFRGPRMGYKTQPNQGIWRSAQNAGMVTLIGGLLLGLLFAWNEGLLFAWNAGTFLELLIGLAWGALFGLFGGGSACIRHFSLRLMLYRWGHAPWNYARFLDRAAEQLFLQKVGGGYIFVHRRLLEHFAQQRLD